MLYEVITGYFGLLGVVSGVAAHSNLGAVFGLLNGREFWHGPYMPIYVITSYSIHYTKLYEQGSWYVVSCV